MPGSDRFGVCRSNFLGEWFDSDVLLFFRVLKLPKGSVS